MNRKRISAILLCLFTLLIPLSACGNSALSPVSDNDFSYSFTDSLGNEVTLNTRPKKIAVLFSSLADLWISAGGSVDVTVGESIERGFADDDAILVDAGSGHTSIDLETLVNEQPDFVIGTADYECQADACRFCLEQGIPAAAFRIDSFEDYLEVLEICCTITGRVENYKLYGVEVKGKIDNLLAGVPHAGDGPDILFIRAGSSARSTKAKTAQDNFACAMLNELGAHNIAEDAPILLDGLSMETVLTADPEYIFITSMGDEEASRSYVCELFEESGWSELTAVSSGNYFFLPKDLFHFKPNSRWYEAYEMLAQLLYGDVT